MKNAIGWAWLMPVMFLLAGPIAATAGQYGDFTYSSDGSAITITGYTGPGGAVVIPDTIEGLPVTSIGDVAFQSCTTLTSVTIPNSVTNIGYHAFFICWALTAITVDEANEVYSSVDGVLFDKSQVTLIQYPNAKTGHYSIPNGVINIADFAFFGCAILAGVTIPNSVTSIGNDAFNQCNSLTSVTIPNSVVSIGTRAFVFCPSLASVTIGCGVASIGDEAFASCPRLTTFAVDEANEVYSSVDGVVFDKSQATLILCPNGKTGSYSIPNCASNIGDYSFSGCWQLTSVTIPNGVTNIGDHAFAGSGLTRVTIPSSVTSLGDAAFFGCNYLAGVFFAGNAPGIGVQVFYGKSSPYASPGPLNLTIYHKIGATGWPTVPDTWADCRTAFWNDSKSVINDYDGDGKSDLAVYDNAAGLWYAYSLQPGRSIIWQEPWGWPGAETVPGDYDGDGVADLAVYDQTSGCWYVWSMARNVCILWAWPWGWSGAETVPGEYNGDGVSDLALFDNDTGCWYIQSSGGATIAWAMPWGWPGVIPVGGDYDGDGMSDMCVYDSNAGNWYVQTRGGMCAQAWGWPGATTVPGDYDGDGKDDLAVYDQPSGNWYAWSLAKNQAIVWQVPWGWTGAMPVPGDYDGDRNADLAVFDNSSGSWYIASLSEILNLQSQMQTPRVLAWGLQWGWPGAIPPGGRE